MSTDQNKSNPALGSERSKLSRATVRLATLAVLVTLLVTTIGCPPKPPPNPNPPVPVEPNSINSPTADENVPSTTSNDTVPSSHEPTDPIDLGPAVQETKEVFRRHGLPEDWYQSLTTANPDKNHSVLVGAIWTMVGPEVASRFQERYRTARTPEGIVSAQGLVSDNKVFDELLYRTFQGDQHGDFHIGFQKMLKNSRSRLPNVDPKFVESDGSVAFARVRDAIVTELQQRAEPIEVDDGESVFNEDDEWCRVVGKWQKPAALPDWAAKQLEWRPVVRVEFLEGDRTQGNVINNGDRRLGLSCYAQVGYRENERDSTIPIYLAGPYMESYYQPVGQGFGGSESFRMTPLPQRECPHDGLVYRDLESLNTEPTESERQRTEAAKPDPRPTAEIPRPMWTGGSGFEVPLQEIHARLNALIQKP